MDSKRKTLHENADELFNKRYSLKSPTDAYTLPKTDEIFSAEAFEFEHLVKMRDELNATKSLLNDKDIGEWRNHTKKTNPCGHVVKKLREQVNPELCTQAWAKFYEILSGCNVIPVNCLENKMFTSLHLCEAPGAFIACLNHYIKSKVPAIQWHWLASTLNPFYEGNDTKRMIEGERFILETEEHWNFGKWFDGDLMNWENLEDLQQQQSIQCLGKANLVTADGSIDCASEPDRQETMIDQLLYCEVVAALTLLAEDGSFVVKMFTMFEHRTICILYLLCCCFTKIEIVKPGTSKAGNSEVYCVCTGFLGSNTLSNDILQKLHKFYTCLQPSTSLFPKDTLPAMFLKSIDSCAKTFTGYQKEAIMRNIDLFENCSKAKKKFLVRLQEYVAWEYLSRLGLAVLDRSLCVIPRFLLTGSELSCWPYDYSSNLGQLSGSYLTRMAMANYSWQQRVVDGRATFETKENLIQDLTHVEPVVWLSSPSVLSDRDFGSDHRVIRLGKAIQKIESSRFCPATFIDELDEAKRCATVLQTASGRSWLTDIERTAKNRLRSAAAPRNLAEGVLCKCHLLEEPPRTRFIDISGDCRFARDVIDCGFFQPENCVALSCASCSAKFSTDTPLFGKTVSTATCLDHSYVECGEFRVQCRVNHNVICGSVFAGCNSDPQESKYDELSSRAIFLNQCLVALNVIKNSEHLVLEISDTLTQFTAGLIYILYLLFEEVAFCPVAGNLKCYPKQFLVCRSYIAANNTGLSDHLLNVARTMAGNQGHDVICLVPIRNLFAKNFYHWLRKHTTDFIKSQFDFIINSEKIWLDENEKIPDNNN